MTTLQAAAREGMEGGSSDAADLRTALKDAEARSDALQQQQDEAVGQLVASKMEIASQALELEQLRGRLRAMQAPEATGSGSGGDEATLPTTGRRRSQSHPAPVQPTAPAPSPAMAAAAAAAATVSQAKTMWGRLRRGGGET